MSGQAINAGLVLASGTILALALLTDWVRSRFWVSEALVCLIAGVLAGPAVFSLFALNPVSDETHRMVLEQAARLTVSLSVMSAALRLPRGWVRRAWRPLLLVLTAGMLAMWVASFALVLGLGVGWLTALLIGAVVTPTDPVLAGGIVRGHNAKSHVRPDTRHAITAESAINDGAALPFVLLPILLMTREEGVLGHFLGHVLLWEVLGAAGIGALIGAAAGRAFRWAEARRATERKTVTAVTLALTLAVLAGTRLMGADGILAVFAAGIAFDSFLGEEDDGSEHFEEAVDRFFTLPVFVLLGVALPWGAWGAIGWPLAALALLVLALRRPPAWALLGRLSFYGDRRTALFAGWFGPIGVAAVFYAMLALHETGEAMVWHVGSAVVAASVVAHGVTATPLTRRYGEAR